MTLRTIFLGLGLLITVEAIAQRSLHPMAARGSTSLTRPDTRYKVASSPYVTLQRGPITATIVNNLAVNDDTLPNHQAGYSGIASLTHKDQPETIFVPSYAGLNFEHIHDGTREGLVEKFEPRKSPIELRIIDDFTVELYQPPTLNWKLESCSRYHLRSNGTIEYTFQCIPRASGFSNGYIGLFWASYIHQPEAKGIHFKGRLRTEENPQTKWILAESESHGTNSTHGPLGFPNLPPVDDQFPLTLVNHPSPYLYDTPYYFGVSHGMALTFLFRSKDRIWFAQSPSGGGQGNPAWDFQWFISDIQVNQAYEFKMRLAYWPYTDPDQIDRLTKDELFSMEHD